MTLTARSRRASFTGAMLAVAAVLAAGCSSAGSGSPSSGSSSSPVSSPAAAATSGSASSGTGLSGTVVAASGGGGAKACATDDLKTTTGDYGGGTPGTYYSVIDFTNTSNASCTLYGYPGVSLRDSSSGLIGATGTRSSVRAASLVTLAPGATANAVVGMTDPSVYPTSKCVPVTSAYLMVYPPNTTQSVELPYKGTTCSNPSVKMLTITTVRAGAS